MDRFEPIDPPPKWAADELSNFLELAHRNGYGTFFQLSGAFSTIRDIDALYRRVVAKLENTPDWFAGFYFLRAHSSLLAAVRLATSGQIPETYMLLRGCLENALYGFHIATRPELREIWLRRHDDKDAMKSAKMEFRIGPIFERLALTNAAVTDIAKAQYEKTIDYGAHPNERAFSQVLAMNRNDSGIHFEVRYITAGTEPAFGACLRSTADIGLHCLAIFRIVFQTRFDVLGITQEIQRLREKV